MAATIEGAAVGFLDRLKSRAETVVQRDPGSVGVASEFAFLDVETTGLDSAKDRILEIGIVVTDSRGTVLDEWSTLVNPGQGVKAGVTHIHGIESSWLAAAPSFSLISHEIARRVNGRVVAAHNSNSTADFSMRSSAASVIPTRATGSRCALSTLQTS